MTTTLAIYYYGVALMYAAFAIFKMRMYRNDFFPVLATKDLNEEAWALNLGIVATGAALLASGLLFKGWVFGALAISAYEVYLSLTFYRKKGELGSLMGSIRLAWNTWVCAWITWAAW